MEIKAYRVPGDGDCLFHAVYHLLQHDPVYRTRIEKLYTHPLLSTLAPIPFSPAGLRALVAWTHTEDSEIGHAQRERIRSLYLLSDTPELARETGYIRNAVRGTKIDTMAMMKYMLNRSAYWGDQLAICALEAHLEVGILVLSRQLSRSTYPLAIVLLLRGEHYDAVYVSRDGEDVYVLDQELVHAVVARLN